MLKTFPMEDDISTPTNLFEAGSNFEQWMEILETTEAEQAYAKEYQKIQKNDNMNASGKDCFAPLMSTGADKRDLQKTWAIIDSGKDGAINEHKNNEAKVLILSMFKMGEYPAASRPSI